MQITSSTEKTPPKVARENSENQSKNTPMNGGSKFDRSKNNSPRLSKEEMNQLWAEGRCFNCRREGHESRNCPDRKVMNAPKQFRRTPNKISSSSVRFSRLEKLGKNKQDVDLKVFSMRISGTKLEAENEHNLLQDAIYIPWLQRNFTDFFGPESALSAGVKPTARFQVVAWGENYVISDLICPGAPLKWQKKVLQQSGFDLKWTLQNTIEWKERILPEDSEEY
ncbi:hypothetical protein M422DRAFT_46257 [Sphaerobolus stellatus SS14]|uniref:CCHC-type domain-containing protein n=1 Tax=Sphaerobolus stellatus (strain SS14) TaxID=990650 RepID=A0A0C9VU88_SPHS4|nr:hypothetical protein M422DRAFT_46257 [Sphaerobolus stellatus SS14]